MVGGRPVAVAVEQRPADASVQDPFERDVVRLRPPLRDDGVAVGKALDT
jgi:hypothetical protein